MTDRWMDGSHHASQIRLIRCLTLHLSQDGRLQHSVQSIKGNISSVVWISPHTY